MAHDRKRIAPLPVVFILLGLLLLTGVPVCRAQELMPVQGDYHEYTVANGDTMYAIARKFDVSIEQIMVANRLTSMWVAPNSTLVMPTRHIPPLALQRGLVLNLPERALYLYENGEVTKVYPVCIGALGRWMTPVADLQISVLARNPTWIPPEWADDETPVPPGPNNPLGDRWIGLSRPGYGIHATNAPTTIGMLASHGCVRMYPEDAHELFEHLDVGMPVKYIYRPIKIGFDDDTREYVMEVHPDVYGFGGNNLKDAEDRLEEMGLLGLADQNLVARIVAHHRGIPEPIINANVGLTLNGKPVDTSTPPIIADNQIIVTTEIFRRLGAQLEWDEAARLLTIGYNGRTITCSIGSSKALVNNYQVINLPWAPRLFAGMSLIPLKPICQALAIPLHWDAAQRTAEITAPAGFLHPSPSPGPGRPSVEPATPAGPTPAPTQGEYSPGANGSR